MFAGEEEKSKLLAHEKLPHNAPCHLWSLVINLIQISVKFSNECLKSYYLQYDMPKWT